MTSRNPTILIADDARVNRTFMKLCLRGHGYQFLEAENGQEVLAILQTQPVDLIILDLMMPVMDGFTCLQRLKAEPRYAALPVIVNSSLEDMPTIEQALEVGSYDYFIKSLPREVSQILLPLKARNAIQAKRLLDTVSEQKAVLEHEIQTAGKYQRFLLPQHVCTPGMTVTQHFHPCLGLGGDFFDVVPLSNGKTAFLMADVSGHGVLSAMIAAILKPLFGRYIRDTESPRSTLQRLNDDLLTLTDDASYITAFVAVYDPARQTLCYANAGHPPALHWSAATDRIAALAATGTFLGMFSTEECELEECLYSVAPGERLLLLTDGVICAGAPQGGFFGLSTLKELLRDLAKTPLKTLRQRIWQELQEFTGGEFADDVTFLAVAFHEEHTPRVIRVPSDPTVVLETVEMLLKELADCLTPALAQAIKMSLVEVLMNAIEHGNLEIDYHDKEHALRTHTLEDLVQERRHQAPYAARQVTVTYALFPNYVTFTIRDDGPGFDWRAYMQPLLDLEDDCLRLHGRGLLITRTCMDRCLFNPQGNEVTLVKYLVPPGEPVSHLTGTGSDEEVPMEMYKEPHMHIDSTQMGHTTVLALSGSIGFAARQPLRQRLEEALQAGCLDVVLDLHQVSFIDSSGLGALVACFSSLRKQGGSMKLARLPQHVEELLEITRLNNFFERCESLTQAGVEANAGCPR